MWRSALWNVVLVLTLLFGIAAAFAINTAVNGSYTQFGILPRSPDRWFHIVLAPFIHGSYGHLASNGIGLAIFGLLTIFRSRLLFLLSSAFIIIFGGAVVWGMGREAFHFGASGWVYGLWAMNLGIAWYDRKVKNIAIALIVIALYGGMSQGLLPMNPSVSFEMHLAGALAGFLCALVYTRIIRAKTLKSKTTSAR